MIEMIQLLFISKVQNMQQPFLFYMRLWNGWQF